jgi:cob(I)alamin adenosyltransferase
MGVPMPDSKFNEPNLTLSRIYTKTGDRGETRLASGEQVPKDSPRLECYGTLDELNAFVGAARVTADAEAGGNARIADLVSGLARIQHELFNLGSILATSPGKAHPKQARVDDAGIEQLEREIDAMNAELPPLRSFVLPGGSRLNAELHVCRTVCRRAERLLVSLARIDEIDEVNIRYVNRLSDAFFVMSRWVNAVMGVEEVLWSPNQAAGARRG